VAAVVVGDQVGDFGRAELHVVDRIAPQASCVELYSQPPRDGAPVAGITCISPVALALETALPLKALSARAMA
jgi:hypothetical protein